VTGAHLGDVAVPYGSHTTIHDEVATRNQPPSGSMIRAPAASTSPDVPAPLAERVVAGDP
jgi:hypothetical protein